MYRASCGFLVATVGLGDLTRDRFVAAMNACADDKQVGEAV